MCIRDRYRVLLAEKANKQAIQTKSKAKASKQAQSKQAASKQSDKNHKRPSEQKRASESNLANEQASKQARHPPSLVGIDTCTFQLSSGRVITCSRSAPPDVEAPRSSCYYCGNQAVLTLAAAVAKDRVEGRPGRGIRGKGLRRTLFP